MVMLIEVEAEPPLLLAQTVYCVRVEFTVGEPEIAEDVGALVREHTLHL